MALLNFKGGGCCKLLCRKAVSLPSWDYFVVLLPLPFVFYFLHPPTVSVPESFLLLHFHKHNLCSLDQSVMRTRTNIIDFLNNFILKVHGHFCNSCNNCTLRKQWHRIAQFSHALILCIFMDMYTVSSVTNITMIIKIKWITYCSGLSLCFIDGHTQIS